MGESIAGSVAVAVVVAAVVVVQSQKGRLSIGWPRPSEASHEENFRRFRTETTAADGGDVAVHAVKGSLADASASGWGHQNPRGDR